MENNLQEIHKQDTTLDYVKKIKNLIRYIDKYHPNDLIHLSSTKINIQSLKNKNNIHESWLSNVYYNPHGLWVSCGSSWLKFIKKSSLYHTKWAKCKYVYIVKVDEDILHIKKLNELIAFHQKYAIYKKDEGYKINWIKVKKDYNGLLICPFLGNKIWNSEKKSRTDYFHLTSNTEKYIIESIKKNIMKYPSLYLEWYRHWEEASGVIWKIKSIKGIELILDYIYE